MPTKTIDGNMLKEMFLSGAALIERNRQNIDALNVFPVPDGDTGTNMTQTMQAAVKELGSMSFPTVGEVSGSVARGALKGARGNSGVILSQIFRGFARALEGHEELDPETFVKAMQLSSETAYKAMMKPKEGTILTVSRVIGEELAKEAQPGRDMLYMMEKVISIGDAILKKTPDMLPVLKQAGVVDSGGKGLMVVYAGFLAALKGEPIDLVDMGDNSKPLPGEYVDDHGAIEDIKFAYCTEFIVSHPRDDMKDSEVARLRKRLERIGDCVLVIGDLEVVKVHVHTNDPGKALQMALELGELDAIKVDNMLEEARERKALNEAQKTAEEKQFGIVAVALGDGLTEIFKDLLVDSVVDGGQTMNPSIDDLLQAIEGINAREIFILPNNTNIILAAQQAAELTEKKVYVLPTKSVPMGIAAAVAFMPGATGDENERLMRQAADAVHTASITYAVRDTTFDGHDIHEGDIMGLMDNKLTELGDNPETVAMKMMDGMVTEDSELIMVYYGEDVTEASATALTEEIEKKHPDCEVTLYSGTQPLYYYLISVE